MEYVWEYSFVCLRQEEASLRCWFVLCFFFLSIFVMGRVNWERLQMGPLVLVYGLYSKIYNKTMVTRENRAIWDTPECSRNSCCYYWKWNNNWSYSDKTVERSTQRRLFRGCTKKREKKQIHKILLCFVALHANPRLKQFWADAIASVGRQKLGDAKDALWSGRARLHGKEHSCCWREVRKALLICFPILEERLRIRNATEIYVDCRNCRLQQHLAILCKQVAKRQNKYILYLQNH